MALAGVSTLGVIFGYAVSTDGTTKPSAFTKVERCSSIGGVSLDTEQIDVSALEDEVSRYVAGRQDTGGTWEVQFNVTDESLTALGAMITAYNAMTTGQRMWFEVYSPFLTNGFFIVAQPPKHLPVPEMGQNEAMTISLTFIIEEYLDPSAAVLPA